MRGKSHYWIACTIGLSALPAQALAQDEAPAPSGPVIEDIIVTAQKRSENLQDVPIAISAITAGALKDKGIKTTSDLSFAVPSLVYNSLAGFAQPFLRGIGTDITGPNVDPSVATYVDGVFVANSLGTIQNLLGVERVEVLAGPQGTLYGRNAVGGAINVVSLTPSDAFEGEASATLGDYDRREGTFRVSGPVTERLFVGVYLAGTRRDSYLDRLHLGPIANEVKHETSWGARLKAVWTPTDDIRLTGSVEKLRVRSFEGDALRQTDPNSLGFVAGGAPVVIRRYLIQESSPGQRFAVDQTAVTLREEIDLGGVKLLGISGYRKILNRGVTDIDGTTAPLLWTEARVSGRQLSQELQLLSDNASNFEWIVGGYYFDDRGGFLPINQMGFAFLGFGFFNDQSFSQVRTRSLAAFAQGTLKIGDDLRVTVGGRYTRDRKRFRGAENFLDMAGNPVMAVVYPGDSKSWGQFTPKLSVDYRAGDTLLYASYSRGFKSGAYNISTPSNPGPVDPEKLTAFEIGSKSDLLGRRLQINTAAYYYDFKDLQTQVTILGSGGSTILQNAAKAEVYGLEVTLKAALSEDFTLATSGAWQHSEYKGFTNFAGVVGGMTTPIDVSGNRLQRAPEWVASTTLDYRHRLANDDVIHANLSHYYNDGFFWSPQNSSRQKSYHLINLSAGYGFLGDKLDVSLWVTNLLDTYYRNASLTVAGFGELAQDAPPRMFGGTVRWRFGS